MKEFKIKISDEDMAALRDNCYAIERVETEPGKEHTDADILMFELTTIMAKDGRFGELLYIPSLEIEEVKT